MSVNSFANAVPPDIPSPYLPDANWADAFEIRTNRDHGTMRALAARTVGTMPRWARVLLKMRNIIVTPFGLKHDGIAETRDCVDIFPILHETEDQIVLGLDDRHLDFRIVVDRYARDTGYGVRATTLVKRHNFLGRAYIAIITPFHQLIVKSVLKNAL